MKTFKMMSVSALTLMMAMGSTQAAFAQDNSDTEVEDVVVATGTLVLVQKILLTSLKL